LLERISDIGKWFHFGTSVALLVSATAQASTFVLLARGLGADAFGRLMIMQAFSQLALEVVALGAGEALIRRVARDYGQHCRALGHALVMTGLSAIVLTAALVGIVQRFEATLTIMAIGAYMFGELLGNRLTNLAEHVFIAHSRVASANAVRIVSSALKLGAVVVGMYGLGFRDLQNWVFIQAGTAILAGAVCVALATARLGAPSRAFHREDLVFGALMAATGLAQAVQFSADRIGLGMIAPPSVVAAYSAGTRAIQVAMIPITAILRNLFSQFFRLGQGGLTETRRFALLNLPKVIVVGLITGAGLIAGSEVLGTILGPGFAETAPILRWLSLIAMFQGIQYLLADAFTGADRQVWRTATNIFGAVGYVGLIATLAIYDGVAGIIAGMYLYQLAMIATYAVILNGLAWRERKALALVSATTPMSTL
jgi:O-antigen/teichoic acid export membrane protein